MDHDLLTGFLSVHFLLKYCGFESCARGHTPLFFWCHDVRVSKIIGRFQKK